MEVTNVVVVVVTVVEASTFVIFNSSSDMRGKSMTLTGMVVVVTVVPYVAAGTRSQSSCSRHRMGMR